MAFITPLERIVVGLVWNVEELYQSETAMRAFFKVGMTAQGLRFKGSYVFYSPASQVIFGMNITTANRRVKL